MVATNPVRADNAGSPELLARASQAGRSVATLVLVSGGFDPIHRGHIALLRAADNIGRVVVALNSDAWLVRKKGYAFMEWEERAAILRACRFVSRVMGVSDGDDTVCHALETLRPGYFVNGGDRTQPNAKEHALCQRLGIRELFNVGGGKVQSSSELIKRIRLAHNSDPVSR